MRFQIIPFDQYQRYNFVRNVSVVLLGLTRAKILEVGGAYSPLKHLLREHDVVLADRTPVAGLDVLTSGLRLPFRDEQFDLVVSTDVVEHIEPAQRSTFLSELFRASSNLVAIGFPRKSAPVEEADRLLFEFIRSNMGIEDKFLEEHIGLGLPEMEDMKGTVARIACDFMEFENANLYSWLPLMMSIFLVREQGDFRSSGDLQNELFNTYYSETSHFPPAYRTFLVCSKQNALKAEEKQRLLELAPNPSARNHNNYALAALSLSMSYSLDLRKLKEAQQQELRRLDQLYRDQVELRQQVESEKYRSEMELKERHHREQDDLENKLREQYMRAENLQSYLNLFLNHPAYRLYKLFKGGGGKQRSDRSG